MIRSVIKKLERRSHHLKEEMILALHDFREDIEEAENTEDDGASASEELDWAKLCNRGGLYHVRTEFPTFLYSVELVMMRKENTKATKEGFSKTVEKAIQDDDVLFW